MNNKLAIRYILVVFFLIPTYFTLFDTNFWLKNKISLHLLPNISCIFSNIFLQAKKFFEKKGKITIARNLGNMNVETKVIANTTGLSQEEIKK